MAKKAQEQVEQIEKVEQAPKSKEFKAKEDFLWFKKGDKVSGSAEDVAKWKQEGLVE
jgi:hypothetical protein